MSQPQQVENPSEKYHKLQSDLQNFIQLRQKLESQLQENKSVQRVEFSSLDDDANIYKLVGPIMLKQEKAEAVIAVDARVEFISTEIKKIEKQIKESQLQIELGMV